MAGRAPASNRGCSAREDGEVADGVEATIDLSEETRATLALDDEPPGRDTPGGEPEPPRRERRTLWSDLHGLVATPARRGRLAVWVAVLGIAVAAPLVT